MARMRSIKPEMFRSYTVNAWPVAVRWTFAGLLTYLDDKGRGVDDVRMIKAEIYPIDDDMTGPTIEAHLETLTGKGPLCRYEVEGRRYLHITSFAEHQSINRPRPSRIPGCPVHESSVNGPPPPHGTAREGSLNGQGDAGRRQGDALGGQGDEALTHKTIPDGSVSRHGALSEPSSPRAQARVPAEHGSGIRDQGSGIRDSATPHAADGVAGELIPLAAPVTAQTLIAEWVEHCPVRPPRQVVGQVAKALGGMLADGIPAPAVRAGLAAWHQAATATPDSRHPATLPSYVHAAANARPRLAPADERVAGWLDLAARLGQES